MDKSHSARLAGALSIGLTAAALACRRGGPDRCAGARAEAPRLRRAPRDVRLEGAREGAPANWHARTRASFVQIRSGGRWKTVARTHTHAGGRFPTHWRSDQLGRFGLRAIAPAAAHRRARTRGKVNVYRAAMASWYGPGLYGNGLACGGTLTPGTLGVANKTLPCGTKVTLRYHGHNATVPVVDRGPYAAGRDYDLTPRRRRSCTSARPARSWSLAVAV